jgi:hypothetical protein
MMSFYLVAGVALATLLGLSFYLSRSVWSFHAEGSRGYIRDMVIYNFAPIGPMVAALLIFVTVQAFNPEFAASSARYALMAVGVLGIFFVRRLPVIKAAQARMQAARSARYSVLTGDSQP